MYNITQNNDNTIDISLTRGDYFGADVGMLVNDEPYTPPGGSCRFAMKKRYKDPDDLCLLNIDIPIGTLLLEIQPQDTKTFPFGNYVYDVEYTDPNGHVDTFIKGKFILTEEVI